MTVHGLVSRSDLNGLHGLVLGPMDRASMRWPVRVWRDDPAGALEVRVEARVGLIPVQPFRARGVLTLDSSSYEHSVETVF